jgi:hypothetical protein
MPATRKFEVIFVQADDSSKSVTLTVDAADSDDVARPFRDHVARCSDMMSPAWAFLLTVGFWREAGGWSILRS